MCDAVISLWTVNARAQPRLKSTRYRLQTLTCIHSQELTAEAAEPANPATSIQSIPSLHHDRMAMHGETRTERCPVFPPATPAPSPLHRLWRQPWTTIHTSDWQD